MIHVSFSVSVWLWIDPGSILHIFQNMKDFVVSKIPLPSELFSLFAFEM